VLGLLINNCFFCSFVVNGTYAYIEASFPRQQNDTARLISAQIPRNTRPGTCVSFWYHMYGPVIDTLSVYTKSGGSLGSVVWQRKGNQADRWKYGQVFLRMVLDYQVSYIVCNARESALYVAVSITTVCQNCFSIHLICM